MIFRFFKQIAGPTVFSKGLAQYRQGQYGIARQLLIKAGQWMPSLASEALFQAATLLCDHQLNGAHNTSQARSVLKALLASPHKDTAQYSHMISDVKHILDTAPPGHGI